MTVYVDDMRAPYGRLIMCHMIADTNEELFAMADKIGVARKWFQNKPSGQHFDIALSKRAMAVKFGAVEITQRQCALMCANRRDGCELGKPETAEAVFRAKRPDQYPCRDESQVVDHDGSCLRCDAIQGEACRKQNNSEVAA